MRAHHSVPLALIVLVVTACGGGGGAAGGASAEQVAAGEKYFMQVCATCHGRDAMGLPNLGKGLRFNDFAKSRSDAELVAFLKEGRRASHPDNTTGVDMPPKGGNPALTEENMAEIVAYVRTLQ